MGERGEHPGTCRIWVVAQQQHKGIFMQRMEKSKPNQQRRECHPWGAWSLQGKMGTDGSAPGLSLRCPKGMGMLSRLLAIENNGGKPGEGWWQGARWGSPGGMGCPWGTLTILPSCLQVPASP